LIRDTHEGYISWKQLEEIQHMMTNNAHLGGRSGAVKRGSALLAGLLRCRRCGRKLMVAYTGNGPFVLRYVCHRSALDNGEPPCITFAGLSLDEAISREILTVLEPAAIEAAVLATEQEAWQQDEVMAALKRELEAAQYTARRAEKQYDTTDPDNRLVASELERPWNDALQKVQQLEMRIEEVVRDRQVAPATREEFEALAGDWEAVWSHPGNRRAPEKAHRTDPDRRACGECRWAGRRDHCRHPLERRRAHGASHPSPPARLPPSSHAEGDCGCGKSAGAHLLGRNDCRRSDPQRVGYRDGKPLDP
jgi:hypothetical protein